MRTIIYNKGIHGTQKMVTSTSKNRVITRHPIMKVTKEDIVQAGEICFQFTFVESSGYVKFLSKRQEALGLQNLL